MSCKFCGPERERVCGVGDSMEFALVDLHPVPGLKAQMPKEGDWNIRETASGDVEAKCTKCGFEMLVNQPGNGLLMVSELLYCPHCGSRMAKGERDG